MNTQEKIKVLKQEPYEDAISREEAIRIAEQGQIQGFEWQIKKLVTLPPVQSKPKTAHWIVHPKNIYAHLVCDRCLSNAPYDCRTNYCPNCGRRMVDLQESESKECL